jgi:ATP/maltotriose-dependent transcriptional regulator MalT
VLVLDDYHLIHTSEIHTLLDRLIEHSPHQLHLVLVTRSDPPLPLARWRAQGHLNDLRHTDLRFTLEETEAFLTCDLGSVAAHESAVALEERTEGWIAVLRLAALSLRSTSDRAAFIERLRSYPDRLISSYLVEALVLPAFKQEQLVQLERWLRLLPEEQIQSSPVLLFARAWSLQAHGQLFELPHVLTTAEQLLATSDSSSRDLDDPQHRLLHALMTILWSQFQYFTGQAQVSLESARSALAWLPPGEEYVASFALVFLAWSIQAIGNEDVALVALQQALRDRSTHLNATARLLFAQSGVYLAAGKLPQLEHTARHLLQITQNDDLVGYSHTNW